MKELAPSVLILLEMGKFYFSGEMCFEIYKAIYSVCNNSMLYRESEGSFEYGNYWRETEDLHAVVQYFCGANRVIGAILGHSKGVLDILTIEILEE